MSSPGRKAREGSQGSGNVVPVERLERERRRNQDDEDRARTDDLNDGPGETADDRGEGLRPRIRRVADVGGQGFQGGLGIDPERLGDDPELESEASLAGFDRGLSRDPNPSKEPEALASTNELEWALRRSEEELQAVLAKIEEERERDPVAWPEGGERQSHSRDDPFRHDPLSQDPTGRSSPTVAPTLASPVTPPPMSPAGTVANPMPEWAAPTDVGPMPAMGDFEDRPGFWSRGKIAAILAGLLVGGVAIGAGVAYFTRSDDGRIDRLGVDGAGARSTTATTTTRSASVGGSQDAAGNASEAALASLLVTNVSGFSGRPISLHIGLAGSGARQAELIHFVGVHRAMRLSAGFKVQNGTWLVPVAALGSLTLTAANNYSGRSQIAVQAFDAQFNRAVSGTERFSVEVARRPEPDRLVRSETAQRPVANEDGRSVPATNGILLQPDRAVGSSEPVGVVTTRTEQPREPDRTTAPAGGNALNQGATGQATAPETPPSEIITTTTTLPASRPAGAVEQNSRVASVEPDLAASEPVAPRVTRTMSENEVRSMMQQANDLLDVGDIAGARLLLEYVAESGSAAGARDLAKTYDPDYLAARGVTGMRPNLDQSIKWYKMAVAFGNRESMPRVRELSKRRLTEQLRARKAFNRFLSSRTSAASQAGGLDRNQTDDMFKLFLQWKSQAGR